MQMSKHVDDLRADLLASAEVGDGPARDASTKLIRSIEPALRLRFLEALGEAAAEVSGQLPAGRVEVRFDGRDPSLAYVGEPASASAAVSEDDLTARTTLRLPESLKVRAEVAAARDALSLNAWLVRVVAAAVDRRPSGRQLRGFARS